MDKRILTPEEEATLELVRSTLWVQLKEPEETELYRLSDAFRQKHAKLVNELDCYKHKVIRIEESKRDPICTCRTLNGKHLCECRMNPFVIFILKDYDEGVESFYFKSVTVPEPKNKPPLLEEFVVEIPTERPEALEEESKPESAPIQTFVFEESAIVEEIKEKMPEKLEKKYSLVRFAKSGIFSVENALLSRDQDLILDIESGELVYGDAHGKFGERISLENEGFICVIEADSSQLLELMTMAEIASKERILNRVIAELQEKLKSP
jgi:hypothetical protein